MKRKIRPAEEEISGVIPAIVFTAVWYSVLIRSIAAAGFDPFLLVFLAAGLLMPYTAVNNVKQWRWAMYPRGGSQVSQGRMCHIRQESTIGSGTADIISFRWKCMTLRPERQVRSKARDTGYLSTGILPLTGSASIRTGADGNTT